MGKSIDKRGRNHRSESVLFSMIQRLLYIKKLVPKPSRTTSGILFMVLHAFVLSVYYVAIKNLTSHMHPNQATFLCKFSILIAIIPWCFLGGFKKNIMTKKIWFHVARSAFSFMGSLCFVYAIAELNISDCTAISYLESIIILIIGCVYFKEKLTRAKVVAIVFCSIGMLLVIKPGFAKFNHYYIYLFLALIFWAINNMAIKVLVKTEHSKAQLFYVMLFSSLILLPLAIKEWQPITIEDAKYLSIVAICYLIHLIAFFKALKYAEISTVIPFDYTRIIIGGALGYFLFQELPDFNSIIGYGFICVGGLYLIYRDRKPKSISKKNKTILALENEYEKT